MREGGGDGWIVQDDLPLPDPVSDPLKFLLDELHTYAVQLFYTFRLDSALK